MIITPLLDAGLFETGEETVQPGGPLDIRQRAAQAAHDPVARLGDELAALHLGDIPPGLEQGVGLRHEPVQLMPPAAAQRVLQHGEADFQTRGQAVQRLLGLLTQVTPQHGAQLGEKNAPARQLVAVAVLGEVGLAAEHARSLPHRIVERQVLEGVKRVVVNEDADGSLRRQQMRGVQHGLSQPRV